MSRSIDEKVVEMRFNNRQFEQGVESTLKYVDELNKGLKFEGASKGLEEVNKEIQKLDVSGFDRAIDVVIVKMQTLGTIGATVIQRLTNAVLDFGKKTVDAFAIEPVTTGFNEYELKMGSVQTIMAATGASVQTVNKYLDELNEYSDRTIYSFADMTNNIGKFTNAGVNLKDAVAAIKGVSNEAALAGANANEASRAMYNFAQALSSGSVKLIDWKSIENANMATVQFKEQLLNTAAEMGTVAKESNGMYRVLTKNANGSSMKEAISATRNFNDSLSHQWMTSEVLIETLKKYSDETTQIGKDAYAAAQDVKTFSMMVDTLKEAAQSGWAETWQLIIGDFEEAKATWTDFTSFFDDIISTSADARNSLIRNVMLLQNAEGLTGREALWQSLLNVMTAVRDILRAVKQAWEDVFPPITDQRLRGIIESIYNFSKGLKITDEQLEKVRATFRGLFAIIDMFVTIIRFAFRTATNLVVGFARVLHTVLFAGFALLLQWIERVKTAETGFNGWVHNIARGIEAFVNYIKSLDGFSLTNILKAIFSFGSNFLSKLFNPNSVFTLLKDFVYDIGVIFYGMITNAETIEGKTRTVVGKLLTYLVLAKDKIIEVVKELADKISLPKLSLENIIYIGIAAALAILVLTFRNFVKSMTGIFESISGVFESISNVINDFGKRLKTESLYTVAKAIMTIVTAIAVLVILANDREKLYVALGVLGIIVAGLVAATFAMSKMSKGQTVAFSATIVSMGIAVKLLASTLKTIQDVAKGGYKKSLTILASLTAGLLVVAKTIGSSTKQYAIGGLTMLAFAATLNKLVDVMKNLDDVELLNVTRSLKIMLSISAMIALIGVGFRNVKVGAALSILATVVFVKQLVTLIASFKDLDVDATSRALKTIAKVFGMFALLMVVANIANHNLETFEKSTGHGIKRAVKSSTNLKQLGSMVLKISASLFVIYLALKAIGSLGTEEISRATSVITKILAVFGLIVAVSFFAGANADKAGSMLIKMSTAITVLSGLMLLLSAFVDPGSLDEPLRIVSQLMVLIGVLVAVTGLVPNTDNVVKVFKSLSVAVLVLAGAIAALSFLPDKKSLAISTAILSGIIAVFSILVASTRKIGKSYATLIVLTAAVTALGGIITLMSYLDVKNSITNAGALAILITSLIASMKILNGMKKNDFDTFNSLAYLLGLEVLLGALMGVVGFLESKDLNVSIRNAGSLAILFTTLSVSMRILSKSEDLDKGVLTKLVGLVLIVGELQLVVGLLSRPGGNGEDGLSVPIQNAVSIGILMLALSASFKVLQNSKELKWDTIVQLGVLAGIVVAFTYLMTLIANNAGEINISIETAASMAVLLVGMAYACKVAASAGVLGAAGLVGLGLFALFVAGMGLLMWGIGEVVRNNPNIEKDLDYAIMVMDKIGNGLGSLVGGVFNGALQSIDFTLFTKFGEDFSGCISAIKPAIEELNGVNPDSFSKLSGLGSALLTLTSASLLDGITKWVNGGSSLGVFGRQLKGFGTGLKGFTTELEGISMGEHVDYAIDLISRLAEVAKQIPNSGGLLSAFVGNNDMWWFATQMPFMAAGIMSFCDGVQSIAYGDHIDQAITVMKKLASAAGEIPNAGGLLALLIGDNNMWWFASQMPIMGRGIKGFCDSLTDLKYTSVSHALSTVDVLRTLATVAQDIPNTGGLLGMLVGNNDMGPFAEQFPVVGEGIKSFCDNIDGIQTGSVDDACNVIRKLVDASKDIEKSGGLSGALFGDQDLQRWGAQITWLGNYLWVYSTWIDSIKDYDAVDKSIEMLRGFADIANVISGINYDRFNMFETTMVEFAQTSLVSFVDVFEQADTKTVGKELSEGITDALHGTRTKFVSEGHWLVDGFLSGVRFKMNSSGGVKALGREMAKTFLDGMEEGLDVNSPSKRTEWIGNMTILGFTDSLARGQRDIYQTGVSLGDYFMRGAQDRLDIHSPSGEGNWLGSMTIEGITEGLTSGFDNLLGQFDGLWGKMQNLASEGISGVTDIIGSNSLWDFSASIGDNLVNAKDKLKEWLGFGDSGGLSDLFGFGSLSETIEEEILNSYTGIQEGMSELANQMSGSGGSASASQLANALKLTLHKHFDSKEFMYLGRQIGEDMAIAANNAIVSKAKAMGETLSEVIAISAGGIDTWKAWLEDRKAYDQIATKDELAGWTLIQKMYKEGTEERMEADKEVYNLQKELVKGTFDYSKQWIDNEKYYERLSLEEELAAWERVQARYMEGTEQRIEAEKEVYRLKKEIRQKEYEDAKKWIETEKSYDRLSLADELAAYLRIQKTTDEGSDNRLEMDQKVYELQKAIYEAEQQYIKDVQNAQEEAAEQRIQLEEEYAAKVKEVNERLADDIAQLNEDYANQVDQRKRSLYSAYGLFDAVKQEEYDKDELMQNLEDQVRAFEEWQITLNQLSARGLDQGLIDELTEMGPSAAGQLKALNEMTDAELGQYNLLWSEKSSMAREQAISELEDLRLETSENIAKLQQSASEELDEYRKIWADAMSQVTEDFATKLEELRKEFGESVGTIKKDTDAKMQEIVSSANRILREAGWSESGEQIANGIIRGLENKKAAVMLTITGLATAAVMALNSVLKINSPSKVMEQSGEYAAEGLIKGLRSYYEDAWTSGSMLAEEIQNGALEAIKYVNDLVESGMDNTFTITPVVDLTNVRAGIDDVNAMLNTSRAVNLATSANLNLENIRDISLINPNEKVVQELQEMRKDLMKLGEKVANMQLVMDTGAVVGEITGPLDVALGSRIIRNTRERG